MATDSSPEWGMSNHSSDFLYRIFIPESSFIHISFIAWPFIIRCLMTRFMYASVRFGLSIIRLSDCFKSSFNMLRNAFLGFEDVNPSCSYQWPFIFRSVLTSGMNVDQYLRNPVLLYQHERGQVIGYVKDLKVENDEVTASNMWIWFVVGGLDTFALNIETTLEINLVIHRKRHHILRSPLALTNLFPPYNRQSFHNGHTYATEFCSLKHLLLPLNQNYAPNRWYLLISQLLYLWK